MAYADRKGFEPDIGDAIWIVVHRMDLVERNWRHDRVKEEVEGRVGISDRRED